MGTKYTRPYFIRKISAVKEKDFPKNLDEFETFISPRAGQDSVAFYWLSWYLTGFADSFESYYSKRKKDGLTPKQRFLKDLKR